MEQYDTKVIENSSRERRRRRRKRRIAYGALFLLVAYGIVWFLQQRVTTTMIFVRHAEPVSAEMNAPLSGAGQLRAQQLKEMLRGVGVGRSVDAIFASREYASQQTVTPVANMLELPVETMDSNNVDLFRETVLSYREGDVVLVATTADRIAPLITVFGGSANIPEIGANDYDNIYVVVVPWFGKEKTLRFKYGQPSIN